MSSHLSSSLFSIGKVAEATRVSVDTIRFYEQKGLVTVLSRTAAGYRQFGADTVRRILFIKRAQDCGFTLNEIKELMGLRNTDDAGCIDVKQKLQKKMGEVKKHIAELECFLQALETLDEVCSGTGPISECPVLEALDLVEEKTVTGLKEEQGFSDVGTDPI